MTHRAFGLRPFAGALCALAFAVSCSGGDAERLEATTKATYDPSTGKLTRLTADANRNGVIDTWTYMDGATVLRTEMDLDEDGRIDRWEHHGDGGRLVKIGFSRAGDGRPDAWAIPGSEEGTIDHVEVSVRRDGTVDRWEWYDGEALARASEDTDRDGKPDKWETYARGAVRTVAFDEDRDGTPDRRLTYEGGALRLIESAPDRNGDYTKKTPVASGR